jgi:transcriptional regulator with XRE-family HTH domain
MQSLQMWPISAVTKPSKSNRALARNLRRLRQEADLSQEAFALKCGLDRTYISGIERATRNVTLATLDRIAGTLGVPPIELLR